MTFYEINFISSYLFNGVILFFLSFVVFFKNKKHPLNITFSSYSFSIAWWSIFSVFMVASPDASTATFWDRVCLIGVIFIPTTFFHFTTTFLNLQMKLSRWVKFCYGLSFIFLVLNFTPYFIETTGPVYELKYFTIPSVGYYIFLSYYSLMIVIGLFMLFWGLRKSENALEKLQRQYLFFSTLVGYTGGSLNYNLVFNLEPLWLVPWGNYFIGIYGLAVAYAIVKYRLLDIKVVVTRAGIFVLVYTLVLGIPFWVGSKLLGFGLWLVPAVLIAVFATIGPFIYLYFQKRAEEKLLEEQKRYQNTLSQASKGMSRVKDLNRLLKLIVHMIVRSVRIEYALVFMRNNQSEEAYFLKSFRSTNLLFPSDIALPKALVKYLNKNKSLVVYEEFIQNIYQIPREDFEKIKKFLSEIEASVVVPSWIEDRLLGVIILGKKKSGDVYSLDDLSVFSILANQAALAIENAQFYEDMKKTQEQLFRAEKMATIGTMADGLSHQINNRFHAMGFIAGDALDTIRMMKGKENLSEDCQELIDDMEFSLGRIEENIKQGGEVVQGLLRYTRKGEQGFEDVNIDELIKSALEMAQFKIKKDALDVVKNYSTDPAPVIKGNFTQLQEVFFNLIDNGYDAMVQRKEELQEEGFHPKVIIDVSLQGKYTEITLKDNGIGVKPEDKAKLFTPFFTTKLSSKKGTGLGLYVIQKIIEDNHGGKVKFDSEYKQGTTMRILLPTGSHVVKEK